MTVRESRLGVKGVCMKNAGLAAVISLFVPGGGQMYAGQLTRGFIILGSYVVGGIIFAVILGATAASSSQSLMRDALAGRSINPYAPTASISVVGIIGWIVLVGMWIWQVYDAYTIANKSPSQA